MLVEMLYNCTVLQQWNNVLANFNPRTDTHVVLKSAKRIDRYYHKLLHCETITFIP